MSAKPRRSREPLFGRRAVARLAVRAEVERVMVERAETATVWFWDDRPHLLARTVRDYLRALAGMPVPSPGGAP